MAVRLTRVDNSNTLTINNITRFSHQVGRFAEAVPIPTMDNDTNIEDGAMVFDIGGVRITYTFEFTEQFSDASSLYSRYNEIDSFLSTIPSMSGLKLEVDENNWTSANGTARDAVLKGFSLERRGGEAFVLRGRIELLGGKLISAYDSGS